LGVNQENFPSGALGVGFLEAELLVEVYRRFVAASDVASGFRSALEMLCRFMGCAAATAWLPSPEVGGSSCCAAWSEDDVDSDAFVGPSYGDSFRPRHDIQARIWQTGRAEWTLNLAAEANERSISAAATGDAHIKAAFGVPIMHDGRSRGVLMFYGREAKAPDERLLRVGLYAADQLGFALAHKEVALQLLKTKDAQPQAHRKLPDEDAETSTELLTTNEVLQSEIAQREQLQETLEERLRQQAAVAAIGAHALRGDTLEALMAEATALVAQSLKVDFCTVLELAPARDALLLTAGLGWREGVVGHAKIGVGTSSQAGYTLLSGQPVIVEDLATESRFEPPALLREHGIVSGLTVIIGTTERPFGVLGAHAASRRTFSQEDVHLLESIAHVLFQVFEHSRTLNQVRRNAHWLERLIATTQDAVLSIDRFGRVLLFNPAAERIFGYAKREVLGQKVNILMAEPYRSEHDEYIAHYEQTGEARAIGTIRTVTAQRKNGELFPIELSVTELREDKEVRYAAFIRDISEKTKMHAQLLESERLAAIGTTAAKIGHELANPINGMSLTIQLLEQRISKVPDGSSGAVLVTVKRLKDEIGRLHKLVGQFSIISRREKYDFQQNSLATVLTDVIALQAPYFAERAIQLEYAIAADLPLVSIDSDKIKQALLNLLKNAGEAMPGGGKITLTSFVSGASVVMELSDTGTGIPLEIDAFDPFVTTKKEGTGVGLVIVRQIMTAHSGKISYRSTPGQGTTFRLELPRAN
jgi:PAS domain S-box-containing protein